ncbi:MAG: ATP-binding protein [Ignavibacteriales bacterium]
MGYIRQFLLLLTMLSLGGYLLYSAYNEVETETINQLESEQFVHARQAATGIRTFFNNFDNLLSYFAKNEQIIRLNDKGKDLLNHFYQSHAREIDAVTRIDTAGRITYTVPFNKELIGRDISAQEHVRKLLRTHKVVVSDVFLTVQGFRSIAYYVPVYYKGRFDGGIAVLVPFDSLTKNYLKDIKVRKSGFAWIISQKGVMLYNPVEKYNYEPVWELFKYSPEAFPMLKDALKGNPGTATYDYKTLAGNKGMKMRAVYLPVKIADTFWSIVVSTPDDEVFKAMTGFVIKWLIIIALLTGGTTIYLYYGIKAKAIVKEESIRRTAEEALKNSEKKYRTLFELSPDAITLTDLDGKILGCNPQTLLLHGFNSEEEVLGRSALDFIIPEEREFARRNLREVLEKGITRNTEYTLIRKDGSRFQAEISSALVYGMDGKPDMFTTVLRDITERKKAEKEIIEAKERAEKSDKLKSEFLAQMSHEIRSPINSILSFSSLLKDDLKDKVSEDLNISFSIIENAGKRIIRTIGLILNMSEIQTGSYEVIPKRIALIKDIMEKLCLEFSFQAREKGLEFSFTNLTAESEIFLTADEYTIGQIFNNLVNNAVKYTEAGKIEIVILKNSMNKLVVEVRDTGIGISDEYLPNLFSPFTQEEQGYTRKYEGNGLGLALVKKYCEINGLNIEVESQKEKGTTFRVIFNNF